MGRLSPKIASFFFFLAPSPLLPVLLSPFSLTQAKVLLLRLVVRRLLTSGRSSSLRLAMLPIGLGRGLLGVLGLMGLGRVGLLLRLGDVA